MIKPEYSSHRGNEVGQPTPKVIAERLLALYEATRPRKKVKCLAITKAQFNSLAGRQKIEESILDPVVRRLRRKELYLVRLGFFFLLLDEGTFNQFDEPDSKTVRRLVDEIHG